MTPKAVVAGLPPILVELGVWLLMFVLLNATLVEDLGALKSTVRARSLNMNGTLTLLWLKRALLMLRLVGQTRPATRLHGQGHMFLSQFSLPAEALLRACFVLHSGEKRKKHRLENPSWHLSKMSFDLMC